MLSELRYLGRSLRAGKTLVLAAILTFAAGVGPGVAVLGLFDRLFLRPLPFHEPERLIQIHLFVNTDARLPQAFLPLLYAEALAERTDIFSGVAWVNGATSVRTRPGPGKNPLTLTEVTGNALEVLGLRPVIGRGFTEADGANLVSRPVLLTHEAWGRRFLFSPDVLAMSWADGPLSYRVIGVLPSGFLLPSSRLMESLDGVFLFRLGGVSRRGALITAPFARLKPGVSLERARSATTDLAKIDWEATAVADAGKPSRSLSMQPLRSGISVLVRPYISLLFGGVWLLLGVACVNLSLLLAAWARSREYQTAIRVSLGAGRNHLARAIVLESMAICGCGALLAWLSYVATQSVLLTVVPPTLRSFAVEATDGRVIAATALCALVASLAVAAAPIRTALSVDLFQVLDRRGRSRKGRAAAPFSLLAIETALAVILITAAAATVPRYVKLLIESPGFDQNDLFVVNVNHGWLPDHESGRHIDSSRLTAILNVVDRVPGVEASAAAVADPLAGLPDEQFWKPSGVDGNVWAVSAGFFDVLRVSFAAGRPFTAEEVTTRSPVAILNQAAVQTLWPRTVANDAIGRSVRTAAGERVVAGVVRNFRSYPGAPVVPGLFLPATATDVVATQSGLPIVVRMSQGRVPDPRLFNTALDARFSRNRVEISSVTEKLLPLFEKPRLLAFLLGVFGGTTVLLIAVGLYAIARFEVNRRSHDMAVHFAVGATVWQLRNLVFRSTLVAILAGIACGLPITIWVSHRWSPAEGLGDVTFAYPLALVAIVLTSVIATWSPINRFARVALSSLLKCA
jgi:predicted permease